MKRELQIHGREDIYNIDNIETERKWLSDSEINRWEVQFMIKQRRKKKREKKIFTDRILVKRSLDFPQENKTVWIFGLSVVVSKVIQAVDYKKDVMEVDDILTIENHWDSFDKTDVELVDEKISMTMMNFYLKLFSNDNLVEDTNSIQSSVVDNLDEKIKEQLNLVEKHRSMKHSCMQEKFIR